MTTWQTMKNAPKDRPILIYSLFPSQADKGYTESIYLASWINHDWIVGYCEETRHCGNLAMGDKPMLWADIKMPNDPLGKIGDSKLTASVKYQLRDR